MKKQTASIAIFILAILVAAVAIVGRQSSQEKAAGAASKSDPAVATSDETRSGERTVAAASSRELKQSEHVDRVYDPRPNNATQRNGLSG